MSAKVIKKNDIILAAVIIIAAFLALVVIRLTRTEGAEVVVTVTENGDSEVLERLPLDEDHEEDIVTDAGTNHLSIHDGRAWITAADCRDKICVDHYSGGICMSGETIVCLPHGLVISIEGGEDPDVDAVAN